jgi:hypothetical protein
MIMSELLALSIFSLVYAPRIFGGFVPSGHFAFP